MAEYGSGTGPDPDRRRGHAGSLGLDVVMYITAVTGVLGVITTFLGEGRISGTVSTVLLVVTFGSAVLVLMWSLLTRRHRMGLPIAILIVGSAGMMGVWLDRSFDEEGGEGGQSEEEHDGGTSTPTPDNPQPRPTPAGNNLCATPPEAPTQTWFLYEDASADRQILVEQDGQSTTPISGVGFSAAGEFVVYATGTERTQVELMRLDTRGLVASTTLDGRVIDTTVSMDGETVVLLEDVAGDNKLTLWRPSDNELRPIRDPSAALSAPALSPSADQLAWIEGGQLIVAELPELTPQRELAGVARDPAWSPDGTTVVYAAPHGDGWAIYATTPNDGGEPWRLTAPVQQTDDDPVVTPTCDEVVYARSQNGTVDLWHTLIDGDEPEPEDDEALSELAGAQTRPAFATR